MNHQNLFFFNEFPKKVSLMQKIILIQFSNRILNYIWKRINENFNTTNIATRCKIWCVQNDFSLFYSSLKWKSSEKKVIFVTDWRIPSEGFSKLFGTFIFPQTKNTAEYFAMISCKKVLFLLLSLTCGSRSASIHLWVKWHTKIFSQAHFEVLLPIVNQTHESEEQIAS